MKTLNQIPTEAQIKKLLRRTIYGSHLFCPKCHSRNIYPYEDRYRCRKCRRSFSLFSGTWIRNMKLPLQTFYSLLWCWTQKVPVLQTQNLCSLSEECVRHWFHVFRLQLPDLNFTLNGQVQMDEAYFKSLSLVMAKKEGTRQLAHSFVRGTSVSRPDVAEFLFQHVQPETDLFTDGAGIYRGIDRWWPVKHKWDIHKKWEFGQTSEIEGMFGCLRTFIRRMYHHVTMDHLPEVVAEFCARFSHPEMFDSPDSYLQKTIHAVPVD